MGVGNTGIGWYSLFSDTQVTLTRLLALERLISTTEIQIRPLARSAFDQHHGTENTANGTAALEFNETGSLKTRPLERSHSEQH